MRDPGADRPTRALPLDHTIAPAPTRIATDVPVTPGQLRFLLFYCYFAFGTLLQVFPPLLTDLGADFAVDQRGASLVVVAFLAPFVVLGIPAGAAIDRVGVLAASRAGLSVMLAGTALTLVASSWALVLAGRAIAGAGSTFLLIAVLKVGCTQTPRRMLGLSLGIFAAGLPVGTGLAFNGLRQVAEAAGWRAALLVAGIIALSAVPVVERFVRGAARAPVASDPRPVLRDSQLRRLAAVTVLAYGAIIGFTTWAPTALVSAGSMPLWVSSLIASVLLVIDIPFAPLWGALSDRLGRRRLFILTGFAVYLVGSLVVPALAQAQQVAWLVAVVAGMGIGCAMYFPVALAIPADLVAAEYIGTAYGFLFTAQMTGMLVGPLLIGQLLEVASPGAALSGVSALAALGLLVAFTLRADRS